MAPEIFVHFSAHGRRFNADPLIAISAIDLGGARRDGPGTMRTKSRISAAGHAASIKQATRELSSWRHVFILHIALEFAYLLADLLKPLVRH